MILEVGSKNNAQYSMSSLFNSSSLFQYFSVASCPKFFGVCKYYVGSGQFEEQVPELDATFCSVGEFSGVGSKPILCT